jgi:hypothetical protein
MVCGITQRLHAGMVLRLSGRPSKDLPALLKRPGRRIHCLIPAACMLRLILAGSACGFMVITGTCIGRRRLPVFQEHRRRPS